MRFLHILFSCFISVGPHELTHTSDHDYMLLHTRPTCSKKLLSSFN